jgi:hypothetical protein
MNDIIPEGASRTYRVKVPDGLGGYKNLTNYSFAGYLRTAPDTAPIVTMQGALDPTDPTQGLIDLLASHTTGRGGSVYRLGLEATNGDQAHVLLGSLTIVNK